MVPADHHNHLFSVPRLRSFDWPPQGSLEYMRSWTLEKGITTLEARMVMQDRYLEPPPLSPMSPPARALDQSRSPSVAGSGTSLNRSLEIPLAAYPPVFQKDNSIALVSNGDSKRRKDTHPPNKCFTCGMPWLSARQMSPSGESSHWFVDIHDGVSRKVAYLFCWQCIEGVQRRLRPSHLGCGHPFSLPFLFVETGVIGREDLMFCRGCRDLIGVGDTEREEKGAGRVL